MDREEFKVIVKAMKAVYTDPKFIPDKDAFEVWYALLGDLSYEQANIAVQKYMLTEKFPPTIADIRDKAVEIVEDVDTSMSELQAWSLVRKAIGNGYYHAEEEYAKLPVACQKAIGGPAFLRECAVLDSDQVATVEQSHFIRNYRTTLQRMKEDAKIPDAVRARLAELRSVVGIGQSEQKLIGGAQSE